MIESAIYPIAMEAFSAMLSRLAIACCQNEKHGNPDLPVALIRRTCLKLRYSDYFKIKSA